MPAAVRGCSCVMVVSCKIVQIVPASSKLVMKLHGPYALLADGYGVHRKSRAEHVAGGNILLVEGVAHEHRCIEVAACNAVPRDPDIRELVAGQLIAQIEIGIAELRARVGQYV